jgi:hypothetical protein
MAIAPKCCDCGAELDDPGALLFSPPTGHVVFKHHLCVNCYQSVLALISARRANRFQRPFVTPGALTVPDADEKPDPALIGFVEEGLTVDDLES